MLSSYSLWMIYLMPLRILYQQEIIDSSDSRDREDTGAIISFSMDDRSNAASYSLPAGNYRQQ